MSSRIKTAVLARLISRVAQRKRAGPITQRSVDRNHSLLHTSLFCYDISNTGCEHGRVCQGVSLKLSAEIPIADESVLSSKNYFTEGYRASLAQ